MRPLTNERRIWGGPGRALLLFGLIATVLTLGILRAEAADVSGGAVNWGFKASFRNYVTGPIAHGNISTAGGATQNSDGTFRFPVSSGDYDPVSKKLTVSLRGSVHFIGHNYGSGNLLDLTISDLRVELNESSGVLIADVASRSLESLNTQAELGPIKSYSNVTLASLSGANASGSGDSFSWSGISAALSSGGVEAFAGFYTAGTALDPLSISVAVEEEATATVAATGTASPTPTVSPTATPAPGTPTATPAPVTATPAATSAQTVAGIQAPAVGDAGLATGR